MFERGFKKATKTGKLPLIDAFTHWNFLCLFSVCIIYVYFGSVRQGLKFYTQLFACWNIFSGSWFHISHSCRTVVFGSPLCTYWYLNVLSVLQSFWLMFLVRLLEVISYGPWMLLLQTSHYLSSRLRWLHCFIPNRTSFHHLRFVRGESHALNHALSSLFYTSFLFSTTRNFCSGAITSFSRLCTFSQTFLSCVSF